VLSGKQSLALLGLLLTVGTAEAADLDRQLRSVEKQISFDRAHGNLTAKQSQTLGTELNGIKDEESKLQASGALSKKDRARLQSKLHGVQDELARVRRRSTTVFDTFQGKAATLETEIAKAKASGQLTVDEATTLNQDLEHLRKKHADIVSSGQLTQEQSDALARDVASLHGRLTAHLFKN